MHRLGRCGMDVSADQLQRAVEGQHGGKAVLVEAVPVFESFNGRPVWEGVVHVFDLEGHPTATRAYAWSSAIDGSDKRRFHAVLHLGGIRSPLDAVRAAIKSANISGTAGAVMADNDLPPSYWRAQAEEARV